MGIYCIKIWICGFFRKLENLAILGLHSCMTAIGWRGAAAGPLGAACMVWFTTVLTTLYCLTPGLPDSVTFLALANGGGQRKKGPSLFVIFPL